MLDAGSVYATLGGRFDPVAFREFDTAVKRSAAEAEAGEARTRAAMGRMSNAVPLKAMNQWDQHNQQAAKNLEKLGKVAATGTAVGILAVGAAAAYAIGKTVSFNAEVLKLHTQAGASTREVERFRGAILSLAGRVPQSPKELAEGMYHLASAGFRGTLALEMLEASAKGAAIGNANLEDTIQASIAIMASHIKGVHGAADAMGQLNTAVGIGDVRMQGFTQALATGLLPTAHDAGLAFKDVAAGMATVTDNATPAQVTATRFRMTISLLAAPSKAAAKALASIGIGSTQLAHDMRQPNGLLVAVEDLRKHLHNSGKTAEEQDAILTRAFGGGRSSAVIHTLMSEIDRLRSKYDELGKSDGAKKLQESWDEFQRKGTADLKEFQSAAEAFAISVGTAILPEVTKLAREGAHAFQSFSASGGAQTVGNDIAHGFETLGQVVAGLAPELQMLAGTLLDLAKAGEDVGQFFGLGLNGQITTAVAAFLAFRGAAFVAPMLLSIAGAMGTVATEFATAPSIAAGVADLVSMVNPATAIAGALGLAGTAFVAFSSGLFSGTSAAEKNAQALEADKHALESLNHATDESVKSYFSLKRAELNHKTALSDLKTVEKEVHDGTLKGAAAQQQLADAHLRVAEATNEVSEESKTYSAHLSKEAAEAKKASNEAFKRADSIKKEIEVTRARNAQYPYAFGYTEKLTRLEKEYREQVEKAQAAADKAAVAAESRRRREAGLDAIKPQNATGVAQLGSLLSELPSHIRTRYELDDQNAQAKLGTLGTKLDELGHKSFVTKVLTTAPNAQVAVEAFKAAVGGVPTSKVLRVLASTHDAHEQLLALRAAVLGIPIGKVIHIVSTASSEKSAVEQLQAAIAGLADKTVTITTVMRTIATNVRTSIAKGFASGRSAGKDEAAIVGEGQGPEYVIDRRTGAGTRVDRPTFMGLGPDEYVIPLEQRYRGRALGLFAQLAADLEIPGYKEGRHPKHKKQAKHAHRPVPAHLDPLSLPVEEIQSRTDHARTEYDKAHTEVNSLSGQVRTAERDQRYASSKGTTKAKYADKLKELRQRLAKARSEERKHHAELVADQKALREAKAYQAKITKQTELANIAANDMKLADGRDDQGGYDSAKQRRLIALGALRKLLLDARKHVKVNSDYFRKLTEQVQGAELETQGTEQEAFTSRRDQAAEREERTGMTDAEQARLKEINKNIALAGLTTTLDDDKKGAQELVTFLEGILGEVEAEPQARGGDEVIADIADQLKTARQNLTALATGSGENSNPDLQAQINQANERAEVAERQAKIAEGALAVFSGSGDIGAGGANAAQAAAGVVVHQTIQTLHPADPATLSAIGNAATAGIGLQGSRRAVRERSGI